MERNPLWKRLLFPPGWLLTLLTIASAAGLPVVFLNDLSEHPIAYAVYALAFYTVCALTVFFVRVMPTRWRSLRSRVYANPFSRRYVTDAKFKTHISLYRSLVANLLYVGANLLSWVLFHSMWFVVLAVYYVILAIMRFLLVRYTHGNELGVNRLGELKRARTCSAILLLVNFALTGAVMMILYQNKGYVYHGILIYVMALYTFYMTTHAIVDLVRYRKYKSPVMTISKLIALSAALVSMLNLETAMFAQFGGEMDAQSQRLMIALTGAGISVAVIVMSVVMIRKTNREIRETERNG